LNNQGLVHRLDEQCESIRDLSIEKITETIISDNTICCDKLSKLYGENMGLIPVIMNEARMDI
jgi:hypothetical protein